MIIEKEVKIGDLYYIALQHPSRESYVDEVEIVNNLIQRGRDSKHRRALDAVLFTSYEEADYFVNYCVNTTCEYAIKKIGNQNKNRIIKLREYKMIDKDVEMPVYKAVYNF